MELLSWPVVLPRCGVRSHSLVIKILLIFATSNPGSILVRMIPFIYGAMISKFFEIAFIVRTKSNPSLVVSFCSCSNKTMVSVVFCHRHQCVLFCPFQSKMHQIQNLFQKSRSAPSSSFRNSLNVLRGNERSARWKAIL